MPAAVGIYERLVESARTLGYDRPDDFLFLPEVENRKTAMVLLDLYFRRVLQASGLRVGKRGQNRTLYSLRHTAITFRLLFGRGIDLLTLARNARTSVEMIERFYASELSAEMNVALLHSRRNFGK
jgi:integrase